MATKLVNGERVTMTADEEQAFRDKQSSPDADRLMMRATRPQVLIALDEAGLLDDVEDYMANTASRREKLAWEGGHDFRRNSPTVNAVATAMGWSDEQLDTLFEAAMKVEV